MQNRQVRNAEKQPFNEGIVITRLNSLSEMYIELFNFMEGAENEKRKRRICRAKSKKSDT